MNKNKSMHMSSTEFRKYGYEVIDWIANYYENVEQYPVKSNVKPGDIRSSLEKNPPKSGTSMEHILEDINKLIMPGITHWQSPKFLDIFLQIPVDLQSLLTLSQVA